MTTLNIRLIGEGLRRLERAGADSPDRNLRIGIQRRAEVVDLVSRSATEATFTLHADVIPDDSGPPDFRGPYVHGPRGDRFLYLSWGEVDDGGTFGMVQRMKIKLAFIDPSLIEQALESGATLHGMLPLTDQAGVPSSGTVKPEFITWTVDFDTDRG